MRAVDPERFAVVMAVSGLKPRFLRELRPHLNDEIDWKTKDFAVMSDRSGNNGVLWIENDQGLYIVPYALSRGIIDKASGRARPVICDFCCTQQIGTLAARISLKPAKSDHSRSLLCCADLACSDHVRGKTDASLRSRAQLREDITQEGRVDRLRRRLGEVIQSLELEPIAL